MLYTLIEIPLEHLGRSIWALLFLLFLSEVLWFFGIHGSMATSAITYTLYQPLELQNLAAFSAGHALFGISEPMKFGIPMTLTPVVNVGLAYLATWLNLIPRMTGIRVPWNFLIISGLIAGDWRTAILQVLQFIIDLAMYYPFVKFLDNQMMKRELDGVAEGEE